MGRVYAVASGKGGVGKTATTANLGTALAAAGHGTVVVDADLGMANLGAALGVGDDGPTIHDVLAGEATVEEALREAPNRPAVLPGSRDLDAFADASPDGLADVLDDLAGAYDHVLVDTGAGLSTDSLAPLRATDEVVLVSTSDPAALDDTGKTATVTSRLGTPLRGLVVARVRGDRADRARKRFDGEVLGTVPEDAAVADAMEAGLPLAEYAPRSPATGAYRRLAATLTGVEVPEGADAAADASDTGTAGGDGDASDAGPADAGADAPEVGAGPEAGDATASAADAPTDEGASADDPAVTAGDPEGIVVEADEPPNATDPDGPGAGDPGETGAGAGDGSDGDEDPGSAPTGTDAGPSPGPGEGRAGPPVTADPESATTDGVVVDEAMPDEVADGAAVGEGEAAEDDDVADGEDEADADDEGDGAVVDDGVDDSGGTDEADAATDDDEEKKGFLSRLFG